MNLRYCLLLLTAGFLLLTCNTLPVQEQSGGSADRREAYLRQLLTVLPPDRSDVYAATPIDSTWTDWLERTGELPPDFAAMPSIPHLPEPLILDEGKENIPVTTIEQWHRKRKWIKKEVQHWITGTIPPPPENIRAEILTEEKQNDLTLRTVRLSFGPDHQAILHVNLIIPPGEGPFPVFMTQWKKDYDAWVQAAVRRGYIGCRYTATDPKYGYPDDSETYGEIWYPEYDFSTLMLWGWGAHRAVDYLYTMQEVNKNQIGLTGLSRNGKQSLMAAAFDERIDAVIPVSGGTGSENPFRYTSEKFDNESIADITTNFPHWLHPRLRFFVGREHKLPVDQNLLMALVAPRGLMVTSSVFENQGNPWGIEQAYLSARKAYQFLGAGENIALDLRYGLHAPAARDMERYIDFFDHIFGRNEIPRENLSYSKYSFSKWLGLSGESINPYDYPVGGIDALMVGTNGTGITSVGDWKSRREDIRQRISWGLGEEPPSLAPGSQPDYMRDVVYRPQVKEGVESESVGFGNLYYPLNRSGEPKNSSLPVVIYLHEYAHPTGYGRGFQPILDQMLEQGFAVYAMDQIGFATRIGEGQLFYERFPHWSKMGRMVADVQWAVDELSQIDFLDTDKIFAAGYSLGGTVGLYSAALDSRLAGVVSVCGFTPMRLDTPEKGTEGIKRYSHLHGLLPRLGFFIGEENRIPYDFHEILASIAPRPALIIAPTRDRFATNDDILACVNEVQKVYDLYEMPGNLQVNSPDDYNRFSSEMQSEVVRWLAEQTQ